MNQPNQTKKNARSAVHFPHDLYGFLRAGILADMRNGLTFKAACKRAGIDDSTGRRWKYRDRSFNLGVTVIRIEKYLEQCWVSLEKNAKKPDKAKKYNVR